MSIKHYLKIMKAEQASDLFLTVGKTACMKCFGRIKPIGELLITSEKVKELAHEILGNDEKIRAFDHTLEANLAISDPEIGRFRVNIYQQSNEVAIVIRSITTQIPSLESLGLPPLLQEVVMAKRGLILVVGATSSGKSTTLASMIDYRNKNHDGHIMTIEEPIEFVYQHAKSIVSQREVGVDTLSFSAALKNALRQAPDMILIGEIREKETMEYAINFAETGHLCLATLHANNANQALERVINFFPHGERYAVLYDLSLNLNAIISLRLIPGIEENTRVAAVEILLASPLVKDFIGKGEVAMIKEIMEKSENLGMQTFDSALFQHYKNNAITLDEALKNADSANNLRLRIQLSEGTDMNSASEHLKLLDENPPEEEPPIS